MAGVWAGCGAREGVWVGSSGGATAPWSRFEFGARARVRIRAVAPQFRAAVLVSTKGQGLGPRARAGVAAPHLSAMVQEETGERDVPRGGGEGEGPGAGDAERPPAVAHHTRFVRLATHTAPRRAVKRAGRFSRREGGVSFFAHAIRVVVMCESGGGRSDRGTGAEEDTGHLEAAPHAHAASVAAASTATARRQGWTRGGGRGRSRGQ